MKSKLDPTKHPIVHKLRGGEIVAWTPEIDAYFGRNRHDNVLAACYKVRNRTDPEFFAANFIEGEYTGRNRQKFRCFGVTRAGFPEMMKHIHNLADKTVLYLAAFDRKAEDVRRRSDPPELDAATIPDDPAALQPVKPSIVIDASEEAGGPEAFARRYLEARGETPTAARLAEVVHHLPPAKAEPQPLSGGPVQQFVFADPDGEVSVRVVDRDGEPWFVAADACRVLDIANSRDAVSRLDWDEKGVVTTDTPGGPQGMVIVSEPGLYSLILTSRRPAAKRFKRWVVHEVLPQIRQTGSYGPADGVRRYGSAEELLNDHQAVAKLLSGYAGQVIALTAENERLEVQLSVVEPKAAALDELGNLKGSLKLRDAAKALGFGPKFFNDRLLQLDVLHYSDGRLVAYQEYVNQGWFIHKPVRLRHRDGTEFIVLQPRVTGHGLAKIAVRLGVGVQAVLGQGVLNLMNRDDSHSDGEALH